MSVRVARALLWDELDLRVDTAADMDFTRQQHAEMLAVDMTELFDHCPAVTRHHLLRSAALITGGQP